LVNSHAVSVELIADASLSQTRVEHKDLVFAITILSTGMVVERFFIG
jgi:hypothetical protein